MSLKEIQSTGNKDTRSGFGDGIVEAARKNPNVIALTADLLGSMKLNQFIKEFPDRFVQCGIAEANMIGVAAGMTIGGKIPFTTTFANFSTGPDPPVSGLQRQERKDRRFPCRTYPGRRRGHSPDPRGYRADEDAAGDDRDRTLRLCTDKSSHHGCG
jgi:hypothetical protein